MDEKPKQESAVIRPEAGDYWTFKLPGRPRKLKKVGSVVMRWFITGYDKRGNPINRQIEYVNWDRQPKGRYSGITVTALMEYGQRVSTKAERDAKFKAQIERRKRERLSSPAQDNLASR